MSFDLVTAKRAEHPFLIESIGIRIYSIEELCWFLYNNLYLIDSNVASTSLVQWVRDELELKGLAKRMSDALDRPDTDISYFVMPVFIEIGYLSQKEMHRLRDDLTKIQTQNDNMRIKGRADLLVQRGRFSAAIALYSGILNQDKDERAQVSFYASVWNNLGCAYARLFLFEYAADAFLQGWKLSWSRELMRRYVSTLPLYLTDEEYLSRLKELGVDMFLIDSIQQYNASIVKNVEKRLSGEKEFGKIDAAKIDAAKMDITDRGIIHGMAEGEDSDDEGFGNDGEVSENISNEGASGAGTSDGLSPDDVDSRMGLFEDTPGFRMDKRRMKDILNRIKEEYRRNAALNI